MREAERALIVGAGIAGLSTALRLHRGGWEVLVVDKAPSSRGGGTWISFRGVGYQAAERMGTLPWLVEAQLPWENIHMLDTDGRLRAVWPAATQLALMNEPTLHVPRGEIEDILLDALDAEVKIEYGTTVSSITQDGSGAEAVLSNGVRERFDLVIGADGVNSVVRQLVCRLGDTFSVLFLWKSTDLRSDLATDLSTSVRRRFEDLGWVVPALLKEVEAVSSAYCGPVSQIKMDTWSQGRVVLVGDVLERHPGDLTAALREWEAEFRPIALNIQAAARRLRERFFLPPSEFAITLRTIVLRIAGNAVTTRLLRLFMGVRSPSRDPPARLPDERPHRNPDHRR